MGHLPWHLLPLPLPRMVLEGIDRGLFGVDVLLLLLLPMATATVVSTSHPIPHQRAQAASRLYPLGAGHGQLPPPLAHPGADMDRGVPDAEGALDEQGGRVALVDEGILAHALRAAHGLLQPASMEDAVDLVLDEVVGTGRLRLALGTTRGAQPTQSTEDVRLACLPVVRRVLPQERRCRRRLGREEEEGVTVVAVVVVGVVAVVLIVVCDLLRPCHPPRHRCPGGCCCCRRHWCGGFPDGIR